MSILCDTELSKAIDQCPPLVSDLDPKNHGRWNSPIQPASVDLSIGEILVPGKENDQLGSPSNPTTRYSLAQGQTAVIKTRETLTLPPDLAGLGFPPSSVSMNGILMTNPGHIDPGYKGQLRFTLNNIGKLPYELRTGDPICTAVFFHVSGTPNHDYENLDRADRPPTGNLDVELLARLSADFLDIDERAKQEAEKTVRDLDIRIKRSQVAVPIIAALIAFIGAAALQVWKPWDDPISKVDSRMSQLEKQLDVKSLAGNLETIEQRLSTLEASVGNTKK